MCVAAYTKHSKVPVWSMDELQEPCYNRPMKVVIGEVAAKINREFFGHSSSPEQVAALAARARAGESDDALTAVYELGFTNQAAAADALAQLTSHSSEGFRTAAISGLGTLGSVRHLGLLTQISQTGVTAWDRYAALKAIGDLGTPESLALLGKARDAATGDDAEDLREIAKLYLDARPPAAPRAVAADAQQQAGHDNAAAVVPQTSASDPATPSADPPAGQPGA